MTPQPGSTITYRKPNGRVATMRVDLVHETEHERWLFSAVDALGNWTAVNQVYVVGVK